MESKDLKQALIVGCLSAAMIVSASIIGNSLKEGLMDFGNSINNSETKIAGSLSYSIREQEMLNKTTDVLNELQAADFLQIPSDKLFYLITNSKAVDGKGIPHFNVGNNVYFSKTALSKWVITSAENGYEY